MTQMGAPNESQGPNKKKKTKVRNYKDVLSP